MSHEIENVEGALLGLAEQARGDNDETQARKFEQAAKLTHYPYIRGAYKPESMGAGNREIYDLVFGFGLCAAAKP